MVRLYPYRRAFSAPIKSAGVANDDQGPSTSGRHHHHSRDLPCGPVFLPKEALEARVRPSDAQMALACLYANRYYTQERMATACRKLYNSEPTITLYDQFEDRKVGLRMITFTTAIQQLEGGGKVAAAVFAFRGTRLTKAGTVSADIQLIKDRNAELYITQRAMKHVVKHIRRLHKEHPDVQWGLFTTGHSLGAFTAIVCTILCDRILASINFESPGLTTYYHRLAVEVGDEDYWQRRVTNYLAIPNPINMCQRHLGRIYRVHFPRIECRTDALHVVKCLFATGVRFTNWVLAATAGYAALRVLLGVSASAAACASLLLSEGAGLGCAIELATSPAGLARGVYWSLHSASAYVAAKLGTSLRYIMQQHSQWHMAQAFDGRTGLPYKAVEMLSWPKIERISGTFGRAFGRAVIESFYAMDTSEGISVMFRRNDLIEARIRTLPGYIALRSADEDTDSLTSENSAACVWQLGDVFELWGEEDDGEGAEHEVADLEGFDKVAPLKRAARGREESEDPGEDADSEAELSSATAMPSGTGDEEDTDEPTVLPHAASAPGLLRWPSRLFPARWRNPVDKARRASGGSIKDFASPEASDTSASPPAPTSAVLRSGSMTDSAFEGGRMQHRNAAPVLLTETDTAAADTETDAQLPSADSDHEDTGGDSEGGAHPDKGVLASPKQDVPSGGSPRCPELPLGGPAEAAEYYGWSMRGRALTRRLRLPRWLSRAPALEGED